MPESRTVTVRIQQPAKSVQGHGTRACYLLGCREARCTQANADYQRRWRAGHPDYPLNRRISDRPPELQTRRRAHKWVET